MESVGQRVYPPAIQSLTIADLHTLALLFYGALTQLTKFASDKGG